MFQYPIRPITRSRSRKPQIVQSDLTAIAKWLPSHDADSWIRTNFNLAKRLVCKLSKTTDIDFSIKWNLITNLLFRHLAIHSGPYIDLKLLENYLKNQWENERFEDYILKNISSFDSGKLLDLIIQHSAHKLFIKIYLDHPEIIFCYKKSTNSICKLESFINETFCAKRTRLNNNNQKFRTTLLEYLFTIDSSKTWHLFLPEFENSVIRGKTLLDHLLTALDKGVVYINNWGERKLCRKLMEKRPLLFKERDHRGKTFFHQSINKIVYFADFLKQPENQNFFLENDSDGFSLLDYVLLHDIKLGVVFFADTYAKKIYELLTDTTFRHSINLETLESVVIILDQYLTKAQLVNLLEIRDFSGSNLLFNTLPKERFGGLSAKLLDILSLCDNPSNLLKNQNEHNESIYSYLIDKGMFGLLNEINRKFQPAGYAESILEIVDQKIKDQKPIPAMLEKDILSGIIAKRLYNNAIENLLINALKHKHIQFIKYCILNKTSIFKSLEKENLEPLIVTQIRLIFSKEFIRQTFRLNPNYIDFLLYYVPSYVMPFLKAPSSDKSLLDILNKKENQQAVKEMLKVLLKYPSYFQELIYSQDVHGKWHFEKNRRLINRIAKEHFEILELPDNQGGNFMHFVARNGNPDIFFTYRKEPFNRLLASKDNFGKTPYQIYFETTITWEISNYTELDEITVNCFRFVDIAGKNILHTLEPEDFVKVVVALDKLDNSLLHELLEVKDENGKMPHVYFYENIIYRAEIPGKDKSFSTIHSILKDNFYQLSSENKNICYLALKEYSSDKVLDLFFYNPNFCHAMELFVRNEEAFPFSYYTSWLIFDYVLLFNEKLGNEILNTAIHLKKSQMKPFYAMIFFDKQKAAERLNILRKILGDEKLKLIFNQDIAGYYAYIEHYLHEYDLGRSDLAADLVGLCPDVIFFEILNYKFIFTSKKARSLKNLFFREFPYLQVMYNEVKEMAFENDLEAYIEFLNSAKEDMGNFCEQPDPIKAALLMQNLVFLHEVAINIGYERTYQSLAQMKKWLSSQELFERIKIDANLFFTHGEDLLQLETVDAELLEEMQSVDLNELLHYFDQINFTDPDGIYYYNPANLKNDRNDDTYEVKPIGEVRKALAQLLYFIDNRSVFVGTPPEGTKELQEYYTLLTSLLKQIVVKLRKLKPQSAQSEQEARDNAKEISESVITMAIAAFHCGGRWLSDAILLLDLLNKQPQDLRKMMVRLEGRHRLRLAEHLAYITFGGDAHALNTVIAEIGQAMKIPGHEYVIEQLPVDMDEEDLLANFYLLYTPERIVRNLIDHLQTNQLLKDLVLQWFKDNIGNYKTKEFNKKLKEIEEDPSWLELICNPPQYKQSEDIKQFINFLNGLPLEELEEFAQDPNHDLQPLIIRSLTKNAQLTPKQKFDLLVAERSKISALLKERETFIAYLLGNRDQVKYLGGRQAYINSIKVFLEAKGVGVEEGTIRLLLQEQDPEKRRSGFQNKLKEIIERQRMDEYLAEIFIEAGVDEEDNPIYEWNMVKLFEMLVALKMLKTVL